MPHFQYYRPGGGYHAWHVDAFGDVADRHLVFLLYLNDVPGGGTEFQLQRYVCEAKKGKVLIFPANFCYPHRSQVSRLHEKYMLTGWATALPPARAAALAARAGSHNPDGALRLPSLRRLAALAPRTHFPSGDAPIIGGRHAGSPNHREGETSQARGEVRIDASRRVR
ncbi:MAG: 2OG-Fe(II) oxygenase [Alphaproteobacteria bacterium]|nr:2OG-Fe(II) oxygenase [Alphaproteobacteria bacterium]